MQNGRDAFADLALCWWGTKCVTSHPDWLAYLRQPEQWQQLTDLVKIESQCTPGRKTQRESEYYVCSRLASASDLLNAVRAHQGAENKIHWILNVVFDEDRSRVRTGHAQLASCFQKINGLFPMLVTNKNFHDYLFPMLVTTLLQK